MEITRSWKEKINFNTVFLMSKKKIITLDSLLLLQGGLEIFFFEGKKINMINSHYQGY